MILKIKTNNKQELIDITSNVKDFVKKSKIKKGLCNIYLKHSTASLIINENADPNIKKDILKALNDILPDHNGYLHDKIDNNAGAHIKSSILGCSLTIPFQENELLLGRWQDIFLVEFDGPRQREIILSIVKTE
ncbi:MAG: secondary thiamine-phosphate synthase enzyme YjbQ [archaeon]